MDCARVRKTAHYYIAGVVSRREAEAVEQHLRDCSACAREIARARQAPQLLAGLDTPRPSSDLGSRIKRAAAGQAPARTTWRVPAYVGAVAACLALVSVIAINLPTGPAEPVQPSRPLVAAKPLYPAETRIAKSVTLRPGHVRPATAPSESVAQAAIARRPHAASTIRPRVAVVGLQPSSAKPAAPVAMRRLTPTAAIATPLLRRAVVDHSANNATGRTIVVAAIPMDLSMASQRMAALPRTPETAAPERNNEGLQVAAEVAGQLVAQALVSRYIRDNVINTNSTALAVATAAPATVGVGLARVGRQQVEH